MSNRYEALISECHENPMYTADMIVSLEATVESLKGDVHSAQQACNTAVYCGREVRLRLLVAERLLRQKGLYEEYESNALDKTEGLSTPDCGSWLELSKFFC